VGGAIGFSQYWCWKMRLGVLSSP